MTQKGNVPKGVQPPDSQLADVVPPLIVTNHMGRDLRDFNVVESLYREVHTSNQLSGDVADLINHVRRGGVIADGICREMGLNGSDRSMVSLAFSLHDMGKLHDPRIWELVNSTKRYLPDSEEKAILNRHSQYSVELLKGLNLNILEETLMLIENHHHPNRMPNENMGVLGEVMYWADRIDAIVDKRPYQDPNDVTSQRSLLMMLRGMYVEASTKGLCKHDKVYDSLNKFIRTEEFRNLYPEIKLK